MLIKIKVPIPAPSPFLPQDDPDPDRKAKLEKMREKYKLSSKISKDNPLNAPLLELPIPEEEAYSSKYQFERGTATVPLSDNEKLLKRLSANPLDAFTNFSDLADYENLYVAIDKPAVAADWLTDERFGEQRISGFNPVMIQSVARNGLPKNLDLEKLETALHKTSLLGDKENLYVVDYTELLSTITKGGKITIPIPTPSGKPLVLQKHLPKPIALLHWEDANGHDPNAKNGRLKPVAIQIDLDDGGDVKIFTPQDPRMLWTIAKLCFCVADANVHEMIVHLGRHHFALEAFGAVTPRQLAPAHPLNILLRPHLRFLVWNNQQGVERLVNQDGPVDLLMAPPLQASREIAITAARKWSVAETFPQNLAARGMDDAQALPHYPFRDDGLLIWHAIHDYVREYLGLYYKCDDDIKDDTELQAWAAELASMEEGGGQVKDMPTSFKSLEDLIDIVTNIIFSNSAGHSAVNFPQYPLMGFIPNAAAAGFADYQTFLAEEDTTEEKQLDFIMKFLPPKFVAIGQIALTYSLSVYHYDRLGDYGGELADKNAKQVIYRFMQNLNGIERKINHRNQSRLVSYSYLLPSLILNSASI